MPDTTIAVICHDYGRYLPEAVMSAVRQSRPAHVVVIDDASNDDTPIVMDQLAAMYPAIDRRHLPANVGLSRVRNLAAQTATTDWVVFLDADDWLTPDFIADAESWLHDHRDVDALTTDMTIVRGRRRRVVRTNVPAFWTDLLRRNTVVQTSLIRRQAILDLGGYDSTLDYEDWDFWIRFLQSGRRIGRLAGPHVFHREHGRNKSKVCDDRAASEAVRSRHARLVS